MLALWIVMCIIALISHIYLYYELLISPIPSKNTPFIQKDLFFIFAIFGLSVIVLLQGIVGLCNYFVGNELWKGFFGLIIAVGVFLLIAILAQIFRKKYETILYQKKRISTEMTRISKNKILYHSFFVILILNYLSALLLNYASKNPIQGLVVSIYIFQIISLVVADLILLHHRYIKNK